MNPNKNIRRFPAFGRQIDEIRKRGLIPNRRVIICFDWEIGKAFPRIVITKECPPERVEFKYLSGLHCQIVFYDRDIPYLNGLIREVLKIKPASLAVFGMDCVGRREPAFQMIHMEAL